MIRAFYAIAWLLLAPLAVLRLAWRARRQPGYLEHLGERFGAYGGVDQVPRIWLHAVSVGETRAALPLVEELARRHPDHRILLTHMTPTGRATAAALLGDRIEQAWLPYDLGFAVRRFLETYRPRAGVLLETEIWPRLLDECAKRQVPALLANARLSPRSAARYARVPRLTRWALSNLDGIAAQTEADALRFRALGAQRVIVSGNVKFDLEVAPSMRELGQRFRAAFGERRVIVAGSTRDGEEALLLEAFAHLAPPRPLLLIVPRHPQRFQEVAVMAEARFEVGRRSILEEIAPGTEIVIGDSMGEMLAYYEAGDVVVMGGSLLPFGSQNLIEACALARPVIVGPHTYNFEDASKGAIAAGAALRARDANEALEMAAALCADDARRQRMGDAGIAFVEAHRGAVRRLADWIDAALSRRR